MFKSALFVLLITMVGCSTTPDRTALNDKGDLTGSCMARKVGDFSLEQWCESLPDEQRTGCHCDDSQVQVLQEAFEKMNALPRTPEDLKNWYRVLPDEWPAERVVAWIASGVPLSEVRSWKDKHYPVDRLSAIVDLGISLKDIRVMIDRGLTVDEMESWLATELPMDVWWVWIGDGVPAESAAKLTTLYDLSDEYSIKEFLIQQRFEPISERVEARTWICSRTNTVAELISVSGREAHYISRLRLVDRDGYELPQMALFKKKIHGQLVRDIRRGNSMTELWSTCYGPALERIYAVL